MADALLQYVRKHDPDRFLTGLFAPAARREALFSLYAFNHEISRASQVASVPPLVLIRLHWWREVAEGARRRHEVAGPVGEAIDAGFLAAGDLVAMVDGRDAEADGGFETFDEWRAWLLGAHGGIAVAAARLLGAGDPEAFRELGAAYGATGVLRAPVRGGRCWLPHDTLAAHGLSPEAAVAEPGAMLPVLRELAAIPRAWLEPSPNPSRDGRGEASALTAPPPISGGGRGEGNRIPRHAIAAALPAVLARRDLRRIGQPPAPRGLADRLAVIAAGALGLI